MFSNSLIYSVFDRSAKFLAYVEYCVKKDSLLFYSGVVTMYQYMQNILWYITMETQVIFALFPMQTIFHWLALGPQWFALGPRGFLDTNMLVSAIRNLTRITRVEGCTQCTFW